MEFKQGDLVMVQLRPKQFPKEKHQKLHSPSASLYKVLKRISSNAYVLELLDDLNISSIVNLKDLFICHDHHEDESLEVPELRLPTFSKVHDQIEDILEKSNYFHQRWRNP